MNKSLKWLLISIAVIGLCAFAAFKIFHFGKEQRASPSAQVVFEQDGLKMEVNYGRPGKKGRVIFGNLVPYGKVWRTGANEATTFSVNKDVSILGKTLKAGKYTLWTIPERDHWVVIFNSKMYAWGVNFEEEALREPSFDALTIWVPVKKTDAEVEEFTISIEGKKPVTMSLSWDNLRVTLPINN